MTPFNRPPPSAAQHAFMANLWRRWVSGGQVSPEQAQATIARAVERAVKRG